MQGPSPYTSGVSKFIAEAQNSNQVIRVWDFKTGKLVASWNKIPEEEIQKINELVLQIFQPMPVSTLGESYDCFFGDEHVRNAFCASQGIKLEEEEQKNLSLVDCDEQVRPYAEWDESEIITCKPTITSCDSTEEEADSEELRVVQQGNFVEVFAGDCDAPVMSLKTSLEIVSEATIIEDHVLTYSKRELRLEIWDRRTGNKIAEYSNVSTMSKPQIYNNTLVYVEFSSDSPRYVFVCSLDKSTPDFAFSIDARVTALALQGNILALSLATGNFLARSHFIQLVDLEKRRLSVSFSLSRFIGKMRWEGPILKLFDIEPNAQRILEKWYFTKEASTETTSSFPLLIRDSFP